MKGLAIIVSTLLFAVVAGCGGDGEPPPRPVEEPFIALDRDFTGFTTWDGYELPDTGLRRGHGSLPPSWLYVRGTRDTPIDEPLPVGTMIVRTREMGEPAEWTVHAMVKRGGGFNEGGAEGWEWFDLSLTPDGDPFITWRGAGDAANPGTYGPTDDGEPLGCNDCHGIVPDNDYVFTRALFSP